MTDVPESLGDGPNDGPRETRPRPQYGEYASPAEVAAARGVPAAADSASVRPASEPGAASVGSRVTATPPQRRHLLTLVLLVFGIWNTVTSIPSFLDLGRSLSTGLEQAGYGSVAFGAAAHVTGIVLLVYSFLVLLAAVGVSFQRIRRGRSSVVVPLIGGAVWVVGLVVGMVIVVANTPGITAVMQNHS